MILAENNLGNSHHGFISLFNQMLFTVGKHVEKKQTQKRKQFFHPQRFGDW